MKVTDIIEGWEDMDFSDGKCHIIFHSEDM